MSTVHTIFTDIFGRFTMSEEFEMRTIFLATPVRLPNGKQTRVLKAGMEVCVIEGELVSAITSKDATHRIIALYGTLNNQDFKLHVINIETNEPSFVNL